MPKQITLTDALHAQNSKVTGISIDRTGRIREILTRIIITPDTKQPKVLYSSGKPPLTLDEELERLGL